MWQSVAIQAITCGADYPIQEREVRNIAESLAGQDSDPITRAGLPFDNSEETIPKIRYVSRD